MRLIGIVVYPNFRLIGLAAANLQIAEGTVKSRTHYALRAFKLALAEIGVDS